MKAARTEASIEAAVVAYAKKHGVIAIKLSTGMFGTMGWPDRLFLGKDMQVRWVEFKTPKGEVTALQRQRHAELAKLGWSTAVVRSVEEGKAVLDNMIKFPLKPDPRQMRMGF